LRIFYGGGTAGRFGAAYELRASTISGGKLYTYRLTATRATWLGDPKLPKQLEHGQRTFRIIA
jgi:hypothetical protein